MANDRRDQEPIKKDQQSPRDVRDEVIDEVPSSPVKPQVKNPNRDRARGDWDRTGNHHDEGTSRAEE
jgi:hypothetical protein